MGRGLDSTQAPITEVAEFLEGLHTVRHYDRPLAPATIVCNRSAIAAIHQGFPVGSMVSLNTDLSILLKGIHVVAARPRTYRETWDLPTVLKHCLSHCTWHLCKSVAVKTAVLLKLALARQWD